MRLLVLLALGFIALLGITFASLNAEPVLFHYYIGVQTLPLSILIIGFFIIGILLGILVSIPSIFRLKMEARRLRRQIREIRH